MPKKLIDVYEVSGLGITKVKIDRLTVTIPNYLLTYGGDAVAATDNSVHAKEIERLFKENAILRENMKRLEKSILLGEKTQEFVRLIRSIE